MHHTALAHAPSINFRMMIACSISAYTHQNPAWLCLRRAERTSLEAADVCRQLIHQGDPPPCSDLRATRKCNLNESVVGR